MLLLNNVSYITKLKIAFYSTYFHKDWTFLQHTFSLSSETLLKWLLNIDCETDTFVMFHVMSFLTLIRPIKYGWAFQTYVSYYLTLCICAFRGHDAWSVRGLCCVQLFSRLKHFLCNIKSQLLLIGIILF